MTDNSKKRLSIKEKLNATFEIEEAGIAHEKAVVEYKKELETPNEDFKSAREDMAKLAEKGMDTLDTLIEIAKERENARDFEVIGQFLKINNDIAKDRIDIHKKKKEIDTGTIEEPKIQGNLTQNNTTVFVGSTTELLKQLNKEQKQKAQNDETVEGEIIEND